MAKLFDQNYQYTSVCSHRSAISAFHEGTDGKSIGENSQISSLIGKSLTKGQHNPGILVFGMSNWYYLKKHLLDDKKLTGRQ